MLRKFVSKIAQSGFYIILFLCISAIGISAYVMYVARNTADDVKSSISTESSIELPFPIEEKTIYDFGTEIEMPQETEKTADKPPAVQPKPEPEPALEKQITEEKQVVEEKKIKTEEKTSAEEKKETAVVYTMALSGAITAPFSGDELVKSRTMDDWRIHAGVDIKGELGSEVRAIADGEVRSVESDTMLGNTVMIQHGDGMVSVYANLADDITVKNGDRVKGGDVVGKVGQSALCECLEESHLHLEVIRNGENIDPLSLFPSGEE
ncbi:MAG: M23 family metallopeptidase [Oscillospiraceae bacterium]|nr:M23 family metallopeptidase [Oscillospiraceae bacterium]